MNYGFKIVYHKSIKWSKELEAFLLSKINHFCSEGSYKCRRDSKAYYRRNIFGLGLTKDFKISDTKNNPIIYTFKRLTSSKRIFGIVPIDEIERKDSKPLVMNECMCAIHRGGQKVKLKERYRDEDYVLAFQTGKIKG